MEKVLSGMVSPEKMGVRGSMWATIVADTITISDLKNHINRVSDLKNRGHEIIYINEEKCKNLIESFLSLKPANDFKGTL